MATQTSRTIISKERRDDTLFLKVNYVYTGDINASIFVDVAVFQPTSHQDIKDAISNRGQSEKQRLKAQADIDGFIATIDY